MVWEEKKKNLLWGVCEYTIMYCISTHYFSLYLGKYRITISPNTSKKIQLWSVVTFDNRGNLNGVKITS